jgi:aspartyl-tRNA(Asn)/glutamyl-tRNA(Gln) amidotransferase subunit C
MIDKEELYTTAELAMLELTDAEAEKLSEAVSQMLEYFSVMADFDVDGLEPTTHALAKTNRYREDSVGAGDGTRERADTLLENAPEVEDRFIVIPNVL